MPTFLEKFKKFIDPVTTHQTFQKVKTFVINTTLEVNAYYQSQIKTEIPVGIVKNKIAVYEPQTQIPTKVVEVVQQNTPKEESPLPLMEKIRQAFAEFTPAAGVTVAQPKVAVVEPLSLMEKIRQAFAEFKPVAVEITPLQSISVAVVKTTDVVNPFSLMEKIRLAFAEFTPAVTDSAEKLSVQPIVVPALVVSVEPIENNSENNSPFLALIQKRQQAIMQGVNQRAEKGERIAAEKSLEQENIFDRMDAKFEVIRNTKAHDLMPLLNNQFNFDQQADDDFNQETYNDHLVQVNAQKFISAIETALAKPSMTHLIDKVVQEVLLDKTDTICGTNGLVNQYKNKLHIDLNLATAKLTEDQADMVFEKINHLNGATEQVIRAGLNKEANAEVHLAFKDTILQKLNMEFELTAEIKSGDIDSSIAKTLAQPELLGAVTERVSQDLHEMLNFESAFLNGKTCLMALKPICQEAIALLERKLILDNAVLKNILTDNHIETMDAAATQAQQPAMLFEHLNARRNALGEDEDSDSDSDDFWNNDSNPNLSLVDVLGEDNSIKGLDDIHQENAATVHTAYTITQAEPSVIVAGLSITAELHIETIITNTFFA